MKLAIIVTALLFGSKYYAQTTVNQIPSTARKVMEEKTEAKPDSSKTGNAYLMSKDYKDTSETYVVPDAKLPSREKDQTSAKNPN